MLNFLDWIKKSDAYLNKAWLLIGKGPSFSKVQEISINSYFTLGLNHVIKEISVDFLHIMDIDVVLSLGDEILEKTEYLILPNFPHESYRIPGLAGNFHRAGRKSVEQWCAENETLRLLHEKERLLCYDASTSGKNLFSGDPIVAGSFSASTLVELLGRVGVKELLTVGIDGGKEYAGNFSELDEVTRLDAGQPSFDIQFAEIARSRFQYGMSIKPLDGASPIRVYVGSQREQEIPFKVLEYSIQKHTSVSVSVVSLADEIRKNFPNYSDITGGLEQHTPFSLQRFAIPLLEGDSGRAIYLDSDMMVFHDLKELWEWPMGKNDFISASTHSESSRLPQFSVLLIDCEKCSWDVSEIAEQMRSKRVTYEELFIDGKGLGQFERSLAADWNSLELYKKGGTKLLHFTNMRHQPWLSTENPLARVWCAELILAVRDKWVSKDEVREHIERGWLRPSLIQQICDSKDDPALLPASELGKDLKLFVPPHVYSNFGSIQKITAFGEHRLSKTQLFIRKGYALIRYFLVSSGTYDFLRGIKRGVTKIRTALSTGLSCK